MDIIITDKDVPKHISRYFKLEGNGQYGVRYFWRAQNKDEMRKKGIKIPLSLSGSVKVYSENDVVISSGTISPSEWGNGMDIIVINSNDFDYKKKYYIQIIDLNLPEANAPDYGKIEIDLYKINLH